jgi:hypothetical protein
MPLNVMKAIWKIWYATVRFTSTLCVQRSYCVHVAQKTEQQFYWWFFSFMYCSYAAVLTVRSIMNADSLVCYLIYKSAPTGLSTSAYLGRFLKYLLILCFLKTGRGSLISLKPENQLGSENDKWVISLKNSKRKEFYLIHSFCAVSCLSV